MEQYKLFDDQQLYEFSKKVVQRNQRRSYSPTNKENTQKKEKLSIRKSLSLIKKPKCVIGYFRKCGITDVFMSDFKKKFEIWNTDEVLEDYLLKNSETLSLYTKTIGLNTVVWVVKIK